MKNCKDCLHYDVCQYHIDEETDMRIDDGVCNNFTDRSECVHLPCKVGDLLYEITERRTSGKWQKVIKKRVVNHIEIGIDGILGARSGAIYVSLSGLHKTVFLTREEAEEVLERMKENEKRNDKHKA